MLAMLITEQKEGGNLIYKKYGY